MAKKRHRPEEIVAKLRQVEVLQSQGMAAADAIRQIGVSEVTCYRWRKEYGGMGAEQLKRLKELESEASCAIGSSAMPNNQRLRRAVSDLTLDKLILTEAAKGNYRALRVGGAASRACGRPSAYRSAGSAARSASTAPPSARSPAAAMTRSG